jgi:hypothetical protein
MLTEEDLFRRGFRKFNPNSFDKDNCVAGFSKVVYNEFGKAYYIQMKQHDWSQWPEIPFSISWTSYVQYHLTEDQTVNVEYHINDDTTVEEIEQFYDQFFQMFRCANYERNY